jgi:hypothetical protein
MKEILRRQNSRTFLAKYLPALLLGVSTGIFPSSGETRFHMNAKQNG